MIPKVNQCKASWSSVLLAEGHQLLDHVFHDAIRGGCTGCDSHCDRSARQEILFADQFLAKRLVFDAVISTDALRCVDVKGADSAIDGDFLEMRGVLGVVAADHNHQIKRFIDE